MLEDSAASPPTDRGPAANHPQPNSRLRAWHVAGAVLLIAVAGLILYGFWPTLSGEDAAGDERPDANEEIASVAAVEATVAQRVSFPLRTEATGHLAPWRRATLSADTEGHVLERPVEEGDDVEQDALLVRVDDRDERIELAEAEAELMKARAEYAVNTREEPSAPAADTSALAAAQRALENARQAFDRGTIGPETLQAARRRVETERVRAGLRRKAVQAATYGLTQAEQRVERARLALERTRLTAPFAGRVADLKVEVGQRVTPGTPVLTLLDDRPMKVTVDVLEEDLVRLQEGATARVHVPALAATDAAAPTASESEALPMPPDAAIFAGRVHAINPLIDVQRGTGRVTVAIPNPSGRLVAGLYATVRLETARLADRLVVPADAVLVRQGRDLVFVVEAGRAQWTYVEVGARSGDVVEITDGISPGDTIAVDGHFALAHDVPVEVTAVQEVAVQ
jgi:HlyD family secretion protein